MTRARVVSSVIAGIVLAIGCGGSKPQDAGAAPQATSPAQAPQSGTQTSPGSAANGSATITGAVQFEGAAPAREKIQMAADPVCQQTHATPVFSEAVVVNDNQTLKNVFVYVKSGLTGTFSAPATPVAIDQAGCWYAPHVLGLQTNQPLEIRNSDATLHNINAKPTQNQPFNLAQPVQGMKTVKKFAKPEIMVSVKCNVHPWMNAYIGVVDHPFFAVSDGSGAFTISGLPAGTYVLEAWHEKYGAQTQNVTVADGQTQSVDFTFKAP